MVKLLNVLAVNLKTVSKWKLAKTTQIMKIHGWSRTSGLWFCSQFTYAGKIYMGQDYPAKSAHIRAFGGRFPITLLSAFVTRPQYRHAPFTDIKCFPHLKAPTFWMCKHEQKELIERLAPIVYFIYYSSSWHPPHVGVNVWPPACTLLLVESWMCRWKTLADHSK